MLRQCACTINLPRPASPLQLNSVTISSYLNSVAIQQFLMVGKNRLCLLQALAIATVMVNPSSVAWKVLTA